MPATIIHNEFTSYDIPEDEYNHACLLSLGQQQVISNLLASDAQEFLELNLSNEFEKSKLRAAELQGSIGAYKHILALHASAVENIENPHTDDNSPI